jgi:hypothetical protein
MPVMGLAACRYQKPNSLLALDALAVGVNGFYPVFLGLDLRARHRANTLAVGAFGEQAEEVFKMLQGEQCFVAGFGMAFLG